MKLQISNKWLLDVNELILMWCSSKTWVDTIWKFWTWLKYAISVLVRNEIDFDIYIWRRKVEIDTKEVFIRDKMFHQVLIDYKTTSITTNLWVEWELWQAVREFIANAMDEWGWYEIVEDIDLLEWYTSIVFDYDQVEECLEYFSFEWWTEVWEWLFYKKLEEKRTAKVYKEWFLVYEASEDSSFDYRIDFLKINESRVAEDRWEVQRWIAKIQSLMNNDDVDTIVKNKETNLWIYYDNDELSDWWDKVNHKDLSWWFELKEAFKKFEAEKKWKEEVHLYNRWYSFVNEDNEIEEWIFRQDYEDDEDTLWDIDLKTNNIYIWAWEFWAEWSDEVRAINDAKKVREANIYTKEHDLKTALDAVLHFKKD